MHRSKTGKLLAQTVEKVFLIYMNKLYILSVYFEFSFAVILVDKYFVWRASI